MATAAKTAKKRAVWSNEDASNVLRTLLANHSLYVIKKRCRKVSEFWVTIGNHVGQGADATQKLIKNLGGEFQKVSQLAHVSGCATQEMKLRGSANLYQLYDEYYQLYFPHGGSVMPAVILTESSLSLAPSCSHVSADHLLSTSAPVLYSAPSCSDDSADHLLSTSAPVLYSAPSCSPDSADHLLSTSASVSAPSCSHGSADHPLSTSAPVLYSALSCSHDSADHLLSTSASARAAAKAPRRRRLARPQQLSNKDYLKQTLALQTKSLQIARQQLRVERERIDALKLIGGELTMLRTMYGALNNVQLLPAANTTTTTEE